jgi:hypothetical protein
MKSNDEDTVRLTIFVPKDTDLMLRTHLAKSGMRKGAISKFVADAVRWQLFHLNLQTAQARNVDVPSDLLEDEIEEALAEVRKERFTKKAK